MFGRQKAAMVVAEFLGTGILVFLILTIQRTQIGQLGFFPEIVAGLALAAMVFAFNKVCGAFLNPALTLALWTARKLGTLTAAVYIAAEFLGGWAAYGVYHYLVHTAVVKLTTTPFSWRTFTAEAIGAGIFGLVWAAAIYQNWSRATTAAVVGVALVIGMIAASTAGYGLINPALALGTRAWNWGTYVAGPAAGAVIGVNLFTYLFASDAERRSNKSVATTATDSMLLAETAAMNKVLTANPTAKRSTTKKTTSRRKK